MPFPDWAFCSILCLVSSRKTQSAFNTKVLGGMTMVTGNRTRTTLILAAAAMLIAVSAVPTQATIIVYHDMEATTGEESTGNVTTHQSGTGAPVELDISPKELINYADGSPTGIEFSVDGANAMDARNTGQTSPPDAGTPADLLFNVPGPNLNSGTIYDRASRGAPDPQRTRSPA
jgi:hypothetical protein